MEKNAVTSTEITATGLLQKPISCISNMEELRDNKASTVVEIVADGDVILVVGPEKVKLRVHSLQGSLETLLRHVRARLEGRP